MRKRSLRDIDDGPTLLRNLFRRFARRLGDRDWRVQIGRCSDEIVQRAKEPLVDVVGRVAHAKAARETANEVVFDDDAVFPRHSDLIRFGRRSHKKRAAVVRRNQRFGRVARRRMKERRVVIVVKVEH